MSWDWDLITRHTYIGITPLWKAVFYGIILSSLGVGVVWYWKRLQLWRQGQPDAEPLPMRIRLQNMLGYALGQKKVPRHRFATLFHLPLYAGFIMLLIGTTLLAIAEWTEIGSHIFLKEGIWFHKGLYYILYEVTLDLFGLGVIFGCILGVVAAARAKARLGELGAIGRRGGVAAAADLSERLCAGERTDCYRAQPGVYEPAAPAVRAGVVVRWLYLRAAV
jgi:hypothetical protein